MKKVLTVISIILCCFLLFACTEKPAETPAEPVVHDTIDVYVTFSNAGELVLKQEKVTVVDTNDDKKFTAQETFDAFHAANNKEIVVSEGFITKLWSIETGGSVLYYVNDVMAGSINEEVKAGDYFYALILVDGINWSDSYSYFTARSMNTVKGEEISFTLKNVGFDASWNTVIAATEGATITVNGTATDVVTDANGVAKITFTEAGTYVISATSTTLTLVPPVCVVTVK
ncbi:MAG: hypothetical protein J5781_04535 [Clostridia bacterium]|nr:hypothetical protein [Clostridia bacterium]